MALLRKGLCLRTLAINTLRNSSTSSKLVEININENNGIATMKMNRQPVNSINLELFQALSEAITEVENSKARGLILTSTSKNVFSAGFDINELIQPEPNRFTQFWTTFQDVWIKLYGTSIPTVAVINGHSPACGCVLSLGCEYRIMLPNFQIGLNESQVGVFVPSWIITAMQNTIGLRQAELAVIAGTMFKTEDALKVRLIDEIAINYEEALIRAEKFLSKFSKMSFDARGYTKLGCRSKDIIALEKTRQEDMEMFYNHIAKPDIQNIIQTYLKSIEQKKSKKTNKK